MARAKRHFLSTNHAGSSCTASVKTYKPATQYKKRKVCPIDREFNDRIAEGTTFSQAETAAILEGMPKEALPPEAVQKLEALGLMESIEVLGRNLRVLMDKVA